MEAVLRFMEVGRRTSETLIVCCRLRERWRLVELPTRS